MNRSVAILFGVGLLLVATTPVAAAQPFPSCFQGEGATLGIGDDPGIDVRLHLSLLTDPTNPAEFGGEFVGHSDGTTIVMVAAGVALKDPQAVAEDPIGAYELISYLYLNLPMFEGHIDETEYEEDVFVDSAADRIDC
ncbi:MAG: hypothetical protein ACLFNI_03520 [Natronomonas sp.]